MRRFEGYTALVTGAGQGIGEAVALRLAREGARVLVTDRDAQRAEAAVERIRTATATSYGADPAGAEAPDPRSTPSSPVLAALPCDVGDKGAVDAAVAHAVERFGGLDVLVNSALSCTPDAPLFEDEPDESWLRDIDITLTGAFRCARAALPHLAAAPDARGAIVSIGSVNGFQDFGNHAYSAAKAGLGSLTRTLAGHAAERGVRVNLVAPGTVRTPNWAGRDDALERASRHYPLGRVGRPEDIAAAVAFLASRDAAWITGVSLPVDGGLTASNLGLSRALRGDD